MSGAPQLDAADRRALDATEKRFWRELWQAAPPPLAAEHGFELATFGPVQATIVRALAPVRAMNLVLGAAEADAAQLGAALDWVEAAGVDAYVAVTPGLPGSAAAEELLGARGWADGYAWMKFVHDLAPAAESAVPGVDVDELAGVPGDGALLGRIIAAGFGMPPWMGALFEGVCSLPQWRCYVARVDGEPAGAAVLLVDGEIAEVGAGATLPAARGRGCQGALLRRRVADARAAGCRLVLAETGVQTEERPNASYRNLLRVGFREAYARPNRVAAPR